ncbi:unnamed protein product, partial [Didymodactylos carnosus]
MLSMLFASVLLVDLKYVLVASENVSSQQCHDLGYSSNTLMCSSCDELKQFKLNKLEDSCKSCCINDQDDQEKGA